MKHLKKLLALLLTFINVKKADRASSLTAINVDERPIREDEIVKRERVEGTPFTIVQMENKTFIALGMYRISNEDLTYKDCKEAIKNKDWGLILNVARLIAMDEINVNEETKQKKREMVKKDALNHDPNKYKR